MKSEVMFRDLPGGPLLVKFADGVSMWCLCSKCGMYSKDMFQDAASHAFCSVCIFQCGERQTILCKQENRDVPVEEMVRAVDIRRVMRDKIVFCPNSNDGNGCEASCALKDLKDHYIECAGTNIACLSCGSIVKGPHWERHINTCPQGIVQCRYCDVAIPRSSLEAHEKLCYDNQDTRQRPIWTTSVSHARDSCSQPSPPKDIKMNMDNRTVDGATVIQAQPICDNVDSDEGLLQCIVCKRNVKRKNLKFHNKICAQKKERSTVSSVGNIPGNIQVTPDSRKNTSMEGPYDPPLEATTVQNSPLSCDPGCIAPDSRNTSIVGSNNPYGEAAALLSSFTSSDSQSQMDDWTVLSGRTDPPSTETCTMASEISEMAEEALQSSLLQRVTEVASAVTPLSCDSHKGTLEVPLNGVRQLLGGISSLAGYFEGADHETSSREGDGASLHQQTTEQSSEWVWNCVFGSDSMKTETAEGSGVVPGITSSSSAANRLEGSSFLLSWPAQPCHRKISEWFDHFEAWLARNDITAEDKRFPLLLNKIPKRVSNALIYLQDNPEPYSAAKFTILHNF
ncbi:uncharacterized protein LOC144142515 isoform X1 [Haemaphysalis longicornis]